MEEDVLLKARDYGNRYTEILRSGNIDDGNGTFFSEYKNWLTEARQLLEEANPGDEVLLQEWDEYADKDYQYGLNTHPIQHYAETHSQLYSLLVKNLKMKQKNKITDVTRQSIADEMQFEKLWYHGNLSEPDFLGRLFNLKAMKSRDYRYSNAYDDIHQHMVNNNDWDADWIYSDPRTNFLHCDDDTYLKFLALTVNPRVRTNTYEVSKLVEIYNKHLGADSYEVIQTDEISSKPIYSGRQQVIGQAHLAAKKAEIKKYLNTAYVNGKINLMNDAISKDTDLAIGTAKELLETTCKSILKQKGEGIDPDWTLSQLIKATTAILDFTPKEAEDPTKADKGIRQILGGIATIVHGVAELRNAYGTGHGKDANFKGLEIKYAKLFVGVVSEIAILYLATNGETAELIETERFIGTVG